MVLYDGFFAYCNCEVRVHINIIASFSYDYLYVYNMKSYWASQIRKQ